MSGSPAPIPYNSSRLNPRGWRRWSGRETYVYPSVFGSYDVEHSDRLEVLKNRIIAYELTRVEILSQPDRNREGAVIFGLGSVKPVVYLHGLSFGSDLTARGATDNAFELLDLEKPLGLARELIDPRYSYHIVVTREAQSREPSMRLVFPYGEPLSTWSVLRIG